MPHATPDVIDLGVDPEAASRLLPHLDSFVKWELLRFLHDNPGATATVEELARYMGRDEMELKPAARALAGAGIFRQEEGDSGYAFSLTSDEGLRRLIRHLVRGFAVDRLVRLAISSHILRSQRQAAKPQHGAG